MTKAPRPLDYDPTPKRPTNWQTLSQPISSLEWAALTIAIASLSILGAVVGLDATQWLDHGWCVLIGYGSAITFAIAAGIVCVSVRFLRP